MPPHKESLCAMRSFTKWRVEDDYIRQTAMGSQRRRKDCNYDQTYCRLYKRISYPPDYVNNSYTEVAQMDLNGNYIGEFNTISSAEMKTGVKGISYVLRKSRNYCGGYYCVKKNDYYS